MKRLMGITSVHGNRFMISMSFDGATLELRTQYKGKTFVCVEAKGNVLAGSYNSIVDGMSYSQYGNMLLHMLDADNPNDTDLYIIISIKTTEEVKRSCRSLVTNI